MFGGTPCPPPKETDDCTTVLPRCLDIPDTTPRPTTRFVPPTDRPTPSPVPPTPAPTAAPTPAPANVAASFVNQFAPTKELKVDTIVLLGVNVENPQASNTLLTWANGSLGVRDAASNSDGVLAHPFSLQIQFPSRRAIKTIKFSQWDPTDAAALVAVNRNERRRAVAPLFVQISDPNADLFAQTASGFDTFEVRPAKGSSFAIVSFESPLPDPSKMTTNRPATPVDDTTGEGGGEEDTMEVTSPSAASSGGLEVWMIAVIAVGVILVLVCVIVLIAVVVSRSNGSDDDANLGMAPLRTVHDERPTPIDSILNGGTVAMQPPQNFYEAAPQPENVARFTHDQSYTQEQSWSTQQPEADHGGIAYGQEQARTSNQYGRVNDANYQSTHEIPYHNAGEATQPIVYNTLPSHQQQQDGGFDGQQIMYSGL
jgi:hypothetical protein